MTKYFPIKVQQYKHTLIAQITKYIYVYKLKI